MGFQTKIEISTSLCCDYCSTTSPELPGTAERTEKRLERQGRKAGWTLLKENSISNKGVRCWRTWTTHAFCPRCVAKGRADLQSLLVHLRKKYLRSPAGKAAAKKATARV